MINAHALTTEEFQTQFLWLRPQVRSHRFRLTAHKQAAPEKVERMREIVRNSPSERYAFKEHIEYCFTRITKTLEPGSNWRSF